MTFLLPSSPWLRKLPKVGDAESCETPIHPMILVIPIDLFRLFILFSQYKSCDNKEKVLKKSVVKKQNMEYLCKYYVYRVEILQG